MYDESYIVYLVLCLVILTSWQGYQRVYDMNVALLGKQG